MTELTDEQLMVNYAQNGDADAFTSLYHRYESKLQSYFTRRLPKHHGAKGATASDLFQRTWLKVHESRKRFDPSKRFSGWVYKIAQNLFLDQVGSSAFKAELLSDSIHEEGAPELSSGSADAAAQFNLKLEWEELFKLLNKLPITQKEALLLAEWDGFTAAQTAEILGVSEVNARKLVSRAKIKLKSLLKGGSQP